MVKDLILVLPSLILVVAIFFQMFFGLIKSPRLAFKYKNVNIVTGNIVSILGILLSAITVCYVPLDTVGFSGSISVYSYSRFLQILILFAGIVTIFLDGHLLKDNRQSCYKFHILLLTALIGGLIAITANDFLTLLISIETLTFSMYFLLAFSRGYSSKEATFKYLITTAVSITFFLFGVSYILGMTSTLNFSEITTVLSSDRINGIMYSVSVLFVFIGLCMKLAVFPFANWVLDVYSGLDSVALNFISTVPKVTLFAVLLNLLKGVFSFSFELYVIILLMAVITAFWANIYAIKENDFKRILGCSSAANASYLLMFLIVAPEKNYSALIFYLICYVILLAGVFSYLNFLEPELKTTDVNKMIAPGKGILKFGYLLAIIGLAGLPISSGFVAKIFLIYNMVSAGVVFLPVIFLLIVLFAIALVYYIKLAKVVLNSSIAITYSKNTMFIFYLVTLFTFVLGICPFDLIAKCVNLY